MTERETGEAKGLCPDCHLPLRSHEGRTCKETWDHLAAQPRQSSGIDIREDRLHPALEAELFAGEDADAKGLTEDERSARDDRRAIEEACS